MNDSLDQALAGISQLIDEAKRDAAESRAQAERWREEYERQRARVGELEAELATCQAKLNAAALLNGSHGGTASAGGSPRLPPRLSRRNTIALGHGALDRHLSPAAFSNLRVRFAQTLQQQQAPEGQQPGPLRRQLSWDGAAGGGAMTLARLSSMLGACLLLESASSSACTGGLAPGGQQLNRQCSIEGEAQVSVLDDGGGAGVGATAAAAVSVALAKSWAAVAGAGGVGAQPQLQRLQRGRGSGSWAGGGESDGGSDGEARSGSARGALARFKLMAAVPRSQARQTKLKTSESRASLASVANGSGGAETLSARSTADGTHRSLFPSESAMALDSLMPTTPRGTLDDAQEATWRACGSHLKLQWLSSPSTVLVVYKPVPAVVGPCVRALAFLLLRGLTVFVEPAVHAELEREVRAELARREERDRSANGAAGAAAADSSSSDAGGGSGSTSPAAGTSPKSLRSLPGANSPPDGAAAGDASPAVAPQAVALHKARPPRPPAPPACDPFLPQQPYSGLVTDSFAYASPPSTPGHRRSGTPCVAFDLPSPPAAGSVGRLVARLRTWDPSGLACEHTLPDWVSDQLDLAITLGGDGTVLWTCSMFASGAVPPIVPFAMGSLGFMTPFHIDRMEAVLHRTTTLEHGFPIMLRHRLQCRIIRADANGSSSGMVASTSASDLLRQGSSSLAGASSGAVQTPGQCGDEMVVLNEVVIDRGATACLANLQVFMDQNFVTTIQGDGLIVATPTGSTAYSLAAGGSMVHPGVPALLFTPICPHTIASRPLVFPEHVVLRVKVPPDSRSEAYCSFDGRSRQALWPGDSVLIRMSPWPVPMVCSLDASHDWFLSVREGLNWNLRVRQHGKGN